jgi:pyruvate dehydrogenase E1 component
MPDDKEERRRQVLAGGYRLRARDGAQVAIVVQGAMVPEAVAAAETLEKDAGIEADVVCLTSADLVFRALQARAGLGTGDPAILDVLFPKPLPLVTLIDGHPHTLAFLAGVHGTMCTNLGVQRFGQAGDLAEIYEHHEIDSESVVGAALDLLG